PPFVLSGATVKSKNGRYGTQTRAAIISSRRFTLCPLDLELCIFIHRARWLRCLGADRGGQRKQSPPPPDAFRSIPPHQSLCRRGRNETPPGLPHAPTDHGPTVRRFPLATQPSRPRGRSNMNWSAAPRSAPLPLPFAPPRFASVPWLRAIVRP